MAEANHIKAPQQGGHNPDILAAARIRRLVLAVGGSPASLDAVRWGCALAHQLDAHCHAVHIETPEREAATSLAHAAEALSLAASLGATVATVPAANAAEGLIAQIEDQAATDLVLQRTGATGWRSWLHAPLADQVARRCASLAIHFPPTAANSRAALSATGHPRSGERPSTRSYLIALGFVVLTTLLAEPVWHFTGSRGVDLLFLLPVIAASVRLGLRQGVVAALLSVFCYNFLFLRPVFQLTMDAPQNAVMLVVLVAVALYTGMLSDRLRGRLRLSDRSAKENAAIVTFAQELARASDWETTADIVCRAVANMFDVRAALLREVRGELAVVGAVPTPPKFGPVDQLALEWTWQSGAESGRGTTQMAAADWQFHALTTSLGTLAILAIAREDGSPPIRADRAMLLSTLVAQASLAHERLRLEDKALEGAGRGART